MRTTTCSAIIKTTVIALAACATLGAASLAQAQQPGPPRQEHHGNDGHSPNQHYEFRDGDRDKLRNHYNGDLKHVDQNRRPDFHAGEPVPRNYRGKIKPLPQNVRRDLPPPPRGYQMGYYGGYAVVYDPVSYTVLQVLDILR